MGVEMDKDNFREDQFNFNLKDFSKDDILGDKLSEYQILKMVESTSNISKGKKLKFNAKVLSKKNSKIYLLKKIRETPTKEQMNEQFEILANLNNNNIAKYYKWSNDEGNIYIIKEFYKCNSLNIIQNDYNSLNKAIDIKLLWSILWQCLSGLKYLHEKNIVHKNIYLKNILMTEDKIIKLNNINNIDNSQDNLTKTKSDDIYDLSQSLKLLGFKKYKPEEIKDFEEVVNLMEKNYKNLTAENLLNLINEKYLHNIFKLSSIISIFRCLFCFPKFVNEIQQNRNYFTKDKTPLSYYYLNCLDNLTKNGVASKLNFYCYNLRNILYKESELNFDNEINPFKILENTLEIFNHETNADSNWASFANQDIISNENKVLALQQFKEYYNKKYNSIISRFFTTVLKTKRICNKCGCANYIFNAVPYIEFNMDMYNVDVSYIKDHNLNNLENWFFLQNNLWKKIGKEYNINCQYCKTNTEHRECKQFYLLPKCLIINLNRGKNYLNKFHFEINLETNLKDIVEEKNYNYKYNLVGIIKRFFDNENGEYFVAFYKDENNLWKKYNEHNNNKVINVSDPLTENEGLVAMLFYYMIE